MHEDTSSTINIQHNTHAQRDTIININTEHHCDTISVAKTTGHALRISPIMGIDTTAILLSRNNLRTQKHTQPCKRAGARQDTSSQGVSRKDTNS